MSRRSDGRAIARPDPGLAIDARDLCKTYPGGVRALDGVSLQVEPGVIFGLLGPNGAGKSTTVKILTTLSRADSGAAWVAGYDVAREPDRVRRAIGAVSQRSAVDPEATGRENLVLQGHLYDLAGRALGQRVDELLERFSLTAVADRLVSTYSGGTRRKLDVALGLVHRPSVLFLDEPTTGLDPQARADLWEETSRLSHEDNLAILLTTHYLEEADRLASRLAILDRGRIVAEGSPDALKAQLRGDAIIVELYSAHSAPHAAAVVAQVNGVDEPTIDGATLRVRADRAAARVPVVLAALDAAKVRAAAITVARPSLDDVYLEYTGRTFRAGSEESVA